MADAAYVDRSIVAAPKNYTLASSQELSLKAVRAVFDGSGAGTSWFPALQLVAPDGTVMWTALDRSTAIAAGGSADASWFPGLGGGGAGAVATGIMAAQAQLSGDFAITKGDPGTAVPWSGVTYDTGSPSPFWTNAHPKRLTAPVDGLYMSVISPIWDTQGDGIEDSQWAVYLYKNTETITITGSYAKANSFPVGTSHFGWPAQVHGVFALNAGDYLICNAYMNDPADPAGTTHWMDLRTHVGEPPLFSSWTLVYLGAS